MTLKMNPIRLASFVAIVQTLGFGCSEMNVEKNRLSQSSDVFDSKIPAFRMCATCDVDFFAVGENECIKIINSKEQKVSETIKIQPEHLSFSPSEPVLGIVTIHPEEKYRRAGTVVFWDCKARKEIVKVAINYNGERINVLGTGVFSPDGKYFAVGSLNGTNRGGLLTLIDMKTQKIVSQTNTPSSAVVSIAMDANADAVYAGTIARDDNKSEFLIWDRNMNKTRTLFRDEGDIWCITISNIHKLIFVGGNEKLGEKKSSIIVWDTVASKIVKPFVGHQNTIVKLALSRDEKYMASGDSEGHVLLWELPTMSIVGKTSTDGNSEIKLLTFVKSELFVGTADGKIRKFQVEED